MKKLFVLYCVLFCFLCFSSSLYAEEIRVGYSNLSKLIEKHDGEQKPVGPLVDYWENMAVAMGVSIQWVGPLPSTRVVSYLKNKKIDAIYIASKNAEREAMGLFPEKPIFVKQPIICFPKGKIPLKLETWDDLQSLKKIGVVNGHRLAMSLLKNYPNLPLALIKDQYPVEFALKNLAKGELDAFIYPGRTGLVDAIKKLGIGEQIAVVNAPVSEKAYFVFFASTRKDLLEKYNAHHDEVKF